VSASARYDGPIAVASRTLGQVVPSRKSPVTATPTITTSGTTTSGIVTNHPGATGGATDRYALNTAEYTFGGGQLAKSSNVSSPFWLAVKARYSQLNTGFGSVTAEFLCDAPYLSVYISANDPGWTRVLVDGAEVLMVGQAIRSGTAQAGSSTTITLDSGASATNGFYATRWVKITGGTGTGQVRQIGATSASYTGSTKVATVTSAWTTAPDSTSTFAITLHRVDLLTTSSGQYVSLDWAGERRMRTYRVETANSQIFGCYTAAIDTVTPTPPALGTPTVWVGDSISYGTGGTAGIVDSSSGHACRLLGWSLAVDALIPGTGYLNDGSVSALTGRDRLLPPANAWVLTGGSSAGTWTITWNGVTTAAIAYNALASAVQTAADTAFGSGVFSVMGSLMSNSFGNIFLIGRGAAASSTATLGVDFSGLTGGWKLKERWYGALDPNVPKDGNGNPLPFNLVLALGTNDRAVFSAAYTSSALYTELRRLILDLVAAYPTARIFVVGPYAISGQPQQSTADPRAGDFMDAALAIRQAATEVAPKIKGRVPLIEPLNFTPSMATTLSSAASIGATTISTVATYAVGQQLVIDSGANGEARTVSAVSGSGPYTLTVPALVYNHSSGATVTPFTSWFTGTGGIGLQAANGTADVCRDTDSVHPTPFGHVVVGTRTAQAISAILSG
jgi:hypothetical protein